MKKAGLLAIVLILLMAVAAAVVLFLLKRHQPIPTQFGWQAHVITLAGDGSPLIRDVAQPVQAGFADPFGIAIAADGSVYISDAGESNRIRKLTPDGKLVTFAGGDNTLNTPSGLALDPNGNLYVADTGNNRIQKITATGVVSTVAGTGKAGYADGSVSSAEFDGPIGVALDKQGNIFVADTYNDRIRKISSDGQVTTVAGSGRTGDDDGEASNARFDTPCGLVVYPDGSLLIADTGNNKLKKLSANAQVTTFPITFPNDPNRSFIRSPLSFALTYDGFLYVTEYDRGTVLQIDPAGRAAVLAGSRSGFSEGAGVEARFNHPAGIGIDSRNGDLVVADSANYLVRKLSHANISAMSSTDQIPKLTPETLGETNLRWPFDPQDRPHEVVATVGEVRGSYDSTDSRDHLHSGLDVFGPYGETVKAIRSEKVTSPMPNWGFGDLSEGLRVGVISYIHMQVGRDKDNNVFKDPRFVALMSDDGKLNRMRVRRGTRFQPGEALGTVNKMYHTHLILGPAGGEINPLSLAPIGFVDKIAPTFETDGVQLFDESGKRFTEKRDGRLIVTGKIRLVVDAFDRNDSNSERRRLGLYSLGYQVLQSDGNSPAPGFAGPRTTILFNRLPADDNAPKIAYAAESGITVYGSKITRFLYEVTNTVRDGHARAGTWNASELPKGNYVLRVFGADYSGNETHQDLPVTVQ
jgi:murein DD-endopeptidase MepM/ murein hydrolase activator NlpD